VVALSSNNVWAVGEFFQTRFSRSRTLTEQWNGTSWVVVQSPNSGADHNELFGVDATPGGTGLSLILRDETVSGNFAVKPRMKKASADYSRKTLKNWPAKVLQTERDTVIELRNEEAINDQALRRIQRDIDLAEARFQRPARKSRRGR